MGLLGRYRGSEWKDSATAAECKQGFSKMHPGFFLATKQGYISCGILVSGIRAHGEHGDVFLFSNLGALWFLENLIRYSLHICYLFPSKTLIYGISRDDSKNFNIRTCEHMILGQLRIWARTTTYAALWSQRQRWMSIKNHWWQLLLDFSWSNTRFLIGL